MLAAALLCGCGSAKNDLLLSMEESESEASSQMSADSEALDDALSDSADVSVESSQIYVYICGAVENPGVYQVEEGSRLFEVVELAGGLREDADEASLNLAQGVSDGEQINVLTYEEAQAQASQGVSAQGAEADDGLVNINTATLSELTQISGIGETRAQAIIDYREKNGAFSSIEDIKNVDGIKDGVFSKIKDYIKAQ